MNKPICCGEVIANTSLGKEFFYCRNCKQEVTVAIIAAPVAKEEAWFDKANSFKISDRVNAKFLQKYLSGTIIDITPAGVFQVQHENEAFIYYRFYDAEELEHINNNSHQYCNLNQGDRVVHLFTGDQGVYINSGPNGLAIVHWDKYLYTYDKCDRHDLKLIR